MPGNQSHILLIARILLFCFLGLTQVASASNHEPAFLALPKSARGSGALEAGRPAVQARLLVEQVEVESGVPFRAGVLIDLAPGWHIYASDPGESGLPTRLAWEIEHATIGPVHFPAHETFRETRKDKPPLTTYGYTRQVLLSSDIALNTVVEGPTRLAATVRFLACKLRCIPGSITLERELLVGAAATPSTQADQRAALFDHYQDVSYRAGQPYGPAMPRSASIDIGMLHAFALALLGGLILNLMPCVLPVLAIKVYGLAGLANASRSRSALHGLAYTSGVLISMLLLAAAVLTLREAGHAVGWGFQFREPIFLAGITTLLLLFALNLFEVFEIQADTSGLASIGSQGPGLRRSFFDGFLAVGLATPCSAPFLGTAVGFAFAGSAIDIVLIFSAIGLGLAFPFALISLVPDCARWLPRSGAWMHRLRTTLGLALLATVVWLLWILARATDRDSLVLMLAFMTFATLGAFALGQLQKRSFGARTRSAAMVFAVLLIAGLAVMPLEARPPATDLSAGLTLASRGAEAGASDDVTRWQRFDSDAIAQELANQRSVFVYFTADWCITCKVNESLVIRDEAVVAEFERLDVATYRGDWTHNDPKIGEALARFGKAGVPVYLVYSPANPSGPEILPEVLTVDRMLTALRRAAAGQTSPSA